MKKIAILGSSGSIGIQTLNVVRMHPDEFEIIALCVNKDIDTLRKQINEFHPKFAGISDENAYLKSKDLFSNDITVFSGDNALCDIASLDVDILVVAVVGMCGLRAVMCALSRGTTVALANKESLVAGGKLVTDTAARTGKRILPIDSEHSAVWQCLHCGSDRELKRIILTASGGPFYGRDRNFLQSVTPEMAVRHPTWNMGKKISVDSATMMNKALEIIEARWLFDTEKIDYIIHPQSIIHSMVEYIDGSIIAQIAKPSMELPIQYALSYPKRIQYDAVEFKFDKNLTFAEPDESVFPLPKLAKQVLSCGGNAPCVFNAANEAYVQLFLDNKIGFCDISINIENILNTWDFIQNPTIEDIYATFNEVYEKLMTAYNK